MKAINTGEKIVLEMDYLDASELAVFINNNKNIDGENNDFIDDLLHKLRNPVVNLD